MRYYYSKGKKEINRIKPMSIQVILVMYRNND